MAALRQVVEERYRDLACLAYMTLDDGAIGERRLAAEAHRAVWAAVPRRLPQSDPDEIYTELRRRLLARLFRGDPRGGRPGRWLQALARPPLPHWLFLQTPTLPWRGNPVGDSMARRAANARAALALAVVDGLTAAQAREVLAAAGIYPGHKSATEPEAAEVPGAAEARPVLAGFDAATLRAVPGTLTRGRRQRLGITAVVLVAVVIAAVIVGTSALNDSHHSGDPVVVSADAWRKAQKDPGDGPQDWPTTGNLSGDWPLLRAAQSADLAGEQLEPSDTVQILYAGDLAGFGPMVVMTDYNQDGFTGPTIPVDAYYPGAPIPLVRLGSYNDSDLTAPDLVPLPGDRFLVPPWRTNLRMAWLAGGGARPAWHSVPVHNGIATGIPQPRIQGTNPGCWANVAAMSYTDTSFGTSHADTNTVLTEPPDGHLLIWPVEVRSNNGPNKVPDLALEMLGDQTCGDQADNASGWLEQGSFQVTVTDIAQGQLPGHGGLVAAITLQVQDSTLRPPVLAQPPFDGSEVQFLNLGTGSVVASASAGGQPPPPVTAVWWKSASGHWYVVAAGQGLRSITAAGLGTQPGPFAVFSAGNRTPAKQGPVLVTSGPSVATVAMPPGKSGAT
jgi:hypothetical protein